MKNILLIGVGRFGQNHLRILNELNRDTYELYASDIDEKELDNCRTYNMPRDRYSKDYKEFFDTVEAVDIVTPTDNHFELCKEFLLSGKDVFVEKPFTMNSKEAEELISIQEQNACILQVGHMHRYNPVVEFAKEEIDSGRLGQIRYIYGHFMGFKRMRTDVGVAHTDSIHYFDICNFLIDQTPDTVQAISKDVMGRGMEDISVVFLNYGDILVQVESGYFAPGKWRDLTIVGSKETIEMDVVQQTAMVHYNRFEKKAGKLAAVRNGITSPQISFQEPLRVEIQDFLNCLQSRGKPRADAKAGLDMIRIVEAVERSSRLRKEVTLNE
jgi:UDP-2-acetamido-3-amino-2,3-dideoxy-glucuronate N-acetyltransferase